MSSGPFPLTSLTRPEYTHPPRAATPTKATSDLPVGHGVPSHREQLLGQPGEYWNVSCMTRFPPSLLVFAVQPPCASIPACHSASEGLAPPRRGEITSVIFGEITQGTLGRDRCRVDSPILTSRRLARPFIGNFQCQLSGFLSGMKRKCF